MPHTEIISIIETLTGKKSDPSPLFNSLPLKSKLDLGFSQFNEILLLLGHNRVNRPFFDFLTNGKGTIESIEQLNSSTEEFFKIALLFFGKITEAFAVLSTEENSLAEAQRQMQPMDVSHYKERHQPILPIQKIDEDKTYFLGYIVQAEIQRALDKNPDDAEATIQAKIRDSIVEQGKRNQEAYLASDHMDVYVATSMREKHEFLLVSRLCEKIFGSKELADLNLRYFDPTQAYCLDRIDKGLSEGLMLKRAVCTIYMAQETDTLGKDSELASTLAQGKPVIAYVPSGSEEYVEDLINDLIKLHPNRKRKELIIEQLRIFDPALAWRNPEILQEGEGTLFDLLKTKVRESYNKRAKTLSNDHPLGIQVDLRNGVANGVLVVRSIPDCIALLRAVIENSLQFELRSKKGEGNTTYWLLHEKISQCVFRAITSNKSLTNSFWNYYLEDDEFVNEEF
ncbi:MAG TPA: hypothetical protein VGD65_23815 [Chryseosolibacter sp.]